MKSLIALFPGQGSQYPGMNKVLLDNFPWTKAFYEEASDAIKENLTQLCLEGPEDKLTLTHNAQPAILTTSYAWFSVLKRESDFSPRAGSGHSLGEYTALLCAGAMDLSTAAKLVRTRGELMQTAVPQGKGKMAALIGLTDAQVIELCEKSSQGNESIVVPANFNAPSQVVIAGHTAAVERAEKLASSEGPLKARKVIPLKVSAPFHSPLMSPVAKNFATHLNAVSWKALKFHVAFNVDAEIRKEGANLPELLTQQIASPVQWTKCTETLQQLNPNAYVEMGPNKVLTGLVKRILDKPKIFSMDTLEDLRSFQAALKENAV